MSATLSPSPADRHVVRAMLERIRAQRLSRNWSQAEMARRAGMSRASYQNLEGGYGNPTLASLLLVLGVFGLSSRLADLVPLPEAKETLETIRASKIRLRASGRTAKRGPL